MLLSGSRTLSVRDNGAVPTTIVRDRFRGSIIGFGSAVGRRCVVGVWEQSPLGAFADVMTEDQAGWRTLIAPSHESADYICDTYVFDDVVIAPVRVDLAPTEVGVVAGPLSVRLTMGGLTLLGGTLRLVPRRLATSPAWATAVDPLARLVMPGVRTRGIARAGRREFYGATEVRRVLALTGSYADRDLGGLRPVHPPCRFGFSSTPRQPSLTRVVTTVERPVERSD